jgi:hypothetical protein
MGVKIVDGQSTIVVVVIDYVTSHFGRRQQSGPVLVAASVGLMLQAVMTRC